MKIDHQELAPPLFGAIDDGDVEAVRAQLDREPGCVHERDEGCTPLMWAVGHFERNPAIVELLLQRGAKVRSRARDGETALHWLVDVTANGTPEQVRAIAASLVEHGADLEAQDEGGRTPLMKAALLGDEWGFAALVAAGARYGVELPPDSVPEYAPSAELVSALYYSPGSLRCLLEHGWVPGAAQLAACEQAAQDMRAECERSLSAEELAEEESVRRQVERELSALGEEHEAALEPGWEAEFERDVKAAREGALRQVRQSLELLRAALN